ncbi:hypothetical protein ACQUSR_02245 [Streptomyces sp. P1-3]|uniref:hypothetical protein n=1 Tax=Streptomyces sp. P1-3 TaxID=3421658 RepID=UPI003D360539
MLSLIENLAKRPPARTCAAICGLLTAEIVVKGRVLGLCVNVRAATSCGRLPISRR